MKIQEIMYSYLILMPSPHVSPWLLQLVTMATVHRHILVYIKKSLQTKWLSVKKVKNFHHSTVTYPQI